ncbi:MAG: S-layer homology domain-containing protein, partial [Sporomusa sp.]
MNKKLLRVAVATALTVAFAVPAFANPFSDVPAKHWAYDAVKQLAQDGIVTGYEDGTFKGDKTVSRYEMASIVASAMQKDLNSDQKQIIDQLSQEFAAELNEMGIKVAKLDKKVDNLVKISGDAR